MNNKHYIGRDVRSLEHYDKIGPITGVSILVDENNEYVAGDMTGYVFETTCPYGTQAMANAMLASLQGKVYKGFRATDAILNINAELGDGITIDGEYTMLAYQEITFGPKHTSEIAAPGESILEHEYPYVGSTQKTINRKIAQVNSKITKTSEEIRLEVSNELENLSSSIDVKLGSIITTVQGLNGKISTLEQTDEAIRGEITDQVNGLSSSIDIKLDGITSTVQGLDSTVSSIEQKVDSIKIGVTTKDGVSTIELTGTGITASSAKIDLSGFVTFTGLSGGTTTIDGACIKTGTIDAERLNLTGAITWGDLSSSVKNNIDEAYDMASAAKSTAKDVDDTVSGWVYGNTTYIDGEMLMTGTVTASSLQGGEVILLGSNGREAASFTLTGASSYSGRKLVVDSGAIEISAEYGDVFISGGDGTYVQISSEVILGGGDTRPNQNNTWSCGTSSKLWSDVYASNGTIITSDLTKKNSVVYGLDAYDSFFDRLKPMSYLLNDGTSGRRHTGLGAQDVEQNLIDSNLTSMDFAGFIKSPKKGENGEVIEGEYDYALRYSEFIALLIYQVQKLKTRVNELEGKS